MGAQQPYLYSAVQRNDSRFPDTTFDPKAVTRASMEPKPRKPKPEGPLVTFNRHPDAHMVLPYRSNNFASMSPRTKSAIKWLRRVQQGLRVLELVGAAGILAMMILISRVETITAWVMRITPGVAMVHCCYAIFHLSREAAGRSPASSAAYHMFAGTSDLCTLPLYAFGAMSAHNNANSWKTLLANQGLMDYFIPSLYYTLICAAGLHLVSLSFSGWLGWMFRRISLMPPDMNPLEDNLTARPQHKKNKSSVTTFATVESDRRLSTPNAARRTTELPIEEAPRPPNVPFMHTRTQSRDSRGSQDLPSRQYQITPGNSPRRPHRDSMDMKRISVPRSSQQASYAEIPMHEFNVSPSRPDSSSRRGSPPPTGKFTETWMPTDSLISRTNQRNRELAAAKTGADKSYHALSQRYNLDDSDSDVDDENNLPRRDGDADLSSRLHPDPLRLNPTKTRAQKPYRASDNSLGEISSNERRVSASRDIADEKPAQRSPWKRNRDSSIQPEVDFYSQPYGDVKSATPPVMVGKNRKVSSGTDFDSRYSGAVHGRRNVSGKVAEEGRAGPGQSRYSRYGVLSG